MPSEAEIRVDSMGTAQVSASDTALLPSITELDTSKELRRFTISL